MVRKLKFHEQKLLKKVDLFNWQDTNTLQEAKIMRRYNVQKREEYTAYNKLSRNVRELAAKIAEVDQKHPFRTEMSALLLEKLYVIGLIPTKWDLENASKITASSFCRRRLPVVMVRNRMSESVKHATQMIEHGHVRVGTEVVKDPAYLVPRTLEDFVTWTEGSAMQRHVHEYNDMRDDFEM